MSRDARRYDPLAEPERPGTAFERSRASRHGGSPLLITAFVAVLAAALLMFVYDSSEPDTADAVGPDPGMGLEFFPNTQATGPPCTGKSVGTTGATW